MCATSWFRVWVLVPCTPVEQLGCWFVRSQQARGKAKTKMPWLEVPTLAPRAPGWSSQDGSDLYGPKA